jgi:release factor glutamine methyltransferase
MVLHVISLFTGVAHQPLRVLDMCTGSGCIGLALAAAFPAWRVLGIDINPAALALAQENKRELGLINIEFELGSLFNPEPWARTFDLIISNPPYINHASRQLMSNDVLEWEDPNALFADNDGAIFYDKLISLAYRCLSPAQGELPGLVMEFGVDQKNMAEYLLDKGCRSVKIHNDSAGLARWAGCQI